jgi:hypothetical protein
MSQELQTKPSVEMTRGFFDCRRDLGQRRAPESSEEPGPSVVARRHESPASLRRLPSLEIYNDTRKTVPKPFAPP